MSLPDDIQFLDDNNHQIDLNVIQDHKSCTMMIPDKMNSICVIDGQHRMYAHYESLIQDEKEVKNDKDVKDDKDIKDDKDLKDVTTFKPASIAKPKDIAGGIFFQS